LNKNKKKSHIISLEKCKKCQSTSFPKPSQKLTNKKKRKNKLLMKHTSQALLKKNNGLKLINVKLLLLDNFANEVSDEKKGILKEFKENKFFPKNVRRG